MSQNWKNWSGQTVGGQYVLRNYLGGTEYSAVYQTEAPGGVKAAIKLVSGSAPNSELQLAQWEAAAALDHPNVLRVLDGGRFSLDGEELLFLVMEYADEDLGQILPQRALTTEETAGMLGPVLDAVEFLHGKNLVHGDLKPSNIHALGDQIKVAPDAICNAGGRFASFAPRDVYSAPETFSGTAATANDLWSLGVTLVEALTQKQPAWEQHGHRGLSLPENLQEPFAGIARQCLRANPQFRMKLDGFRKALSSPAGTAVEAEPEPVAVESEVAPAVLAKTASTLDPVAIPLSTARPVAPQRHEAYVAPAKREVERTNPARENSTGNVKRFVIPAAAAVLLILGIALVPKLFRSSAENPETKESVPPVAAPAPNTKSPSQPSPEKRKSTANEPAKKTVPKNEPAVAENMAARTAIPAERPAPPKEIPARSAAVDEEKGDVLDQVLPQVSEKARSTIQGTVRVPVRIRVNAAGTVDSAELAAPVSSKYFSDLALNAAKKWQFSSPTVNGHSAASEWLVRFEFSPTTVNAYPSQVAQ